MLETPPALGRDFLAEEDQPGHNKVAIIAHGFRVRRFGEKNCIGEIIRLDDEPFEVIGVLPQSFRFPAPTDVETLTPIALGEDQATRESSMKNGIRQIKVIARLNPDVALEAAQSEIQSVQQGIVQAYPDFQEGREARLRTLHDYLSANVSRTSLVLMGAIGFLWLLGCLNVGNLLLAAFAALALLLAAVGIYSAMSYAGQQRTREIAIRLALESQRSQVLLMMVKEGLLLSLMGAAIGTAGALAASRLLSTMLYEVAPSDPYTFIIVLALLFFTAMCGCFFPAYRAAKVESIRILRYE